jgi:hypothetical protein
MLARTRHAKAVMYKTCCTAYLQYAERISIISMMVYMTASEGFFALHAVCANKHVHAAVCCKLIYALNMYVCMHVGVFLSCCVRLETHYERVYVFYCILM